MFVVLWVLRARAWKTRLHWRADFPLVFSGRRAWRPPCRGAVVLSVGLMKHQKEGFTLQAIRPSTWSPEPRRGYAGRMAGFVPSSSDEKLPSSAA